MITLSAAVTHIQTEQESMDQTQMYTLIASRKCTTPVLKPPPIYARNPGQVDSNSVINYDSDVVAKRYRYATEALSLHMFDHTTGKVLEITTSITEMSNKSGWGSGS